jgi:hypothetical protein
MYHNTRFQIVSQSHSTKTAWYQHKNRQEDQYKRIKESEINPNTCSLILIKESKTYIEEKTSWFLEHWLSTCRRNWTSISYPVQKSIKNVSEIHRKTQEDISIGN